MVQGTASGVGKSLLATALCRIYARRGVRVAPFKALNLSLNSAVTPDGAEIGRAQYAQAEAARVTPTAEMNPLLLKPGAGGGAHLVARGRVLEGVPLSDTARLLPLMRRVAGEALDALRERFELLVLEGAGSPAEVNLRERDVANMWAAHRADARVVLVADVERGGALASLVGTLALLAPEERARVQALVVNKFQGDPALFAGGVRFLEEHLAVRVAGVVPHLGETGLASEDALSLPPAAPPPGAAAGAPRVCLVRLPHLSNFDELEPLSRERGLDVRWCETPEGLAGARLVVLPGSKCTAADLAWLRRTGLAGALVRHARAGGALLGVCGGYQMLGERVLDPLGVESATPDVPGLGLLPVVTRFAREKVTLPVRVRLAEGLPALGPAGGAEAEGYEVHCGRVEVAAGAQPFGLQVRRGAEACRLEEGCQVGGVAGTLVHGLLADGAVRRGLVAALGGAAGPEEDGRLRPGADPYDALADRVERALDMALLDRLAGV
jgi:adenosylcobyric acid synthase